MKLTIREDDSAWPKKNVVGRQELEVRIDKEHISFEVGILWEDCEERVEVAKRSLLKIHDERSHGDLQRCMWLQLR